MAPQYSQNQVSNSSLSSLGIQGPGRLIHSFWKGPFATLNLGCSCLGASNKFLTGIYNPWFAHLHWRQALPPNRLPIIVEQGLGASMQLGRETATNPRVAGKLSPRHPPYLALNLGAFPRG